MTEVNLSLENWETESGQYLLVGRKIEDVSSKKIYVIDGYFIDEDGQPAGIDLKQIPSFKKQSPEIWSMYFYELCEGFEKAALTIEGFAEGQNKELKSAVSSLKNKLVIYYTNLALKEKKATLDAIEKEKQDKIDAENAEIARLAEEKRLKEEREAKEAIEREERIKIETANREKEKAFDKEIELDILLCEVSGNKN